MKFTDWLKSKLEQRDIKASELAYRSGISNAEISRILTGVRTPSAKTVKKISPILRVTEEEALIAAGILSPNKKQPSTIEIPIRGICPAGKLNFAFEEIVDSVVLNFDQVHDKSAFALRVSGDCLSGVGVNDGDLVIISPNAEIHNGDLVVARVGDECTMKKFYKAEEQIILQPCNHDYNPIILNPRKKEVEIIGKVIKALKNFG